jgi:RNA polymerase sigma-70 factor (ECF subfamily)
MMNGLREASAMDESLRPLLFSIAYGMLGSVSEAEDIAQEAFLRFYRAEAAGTRIDAPKAFLSATTVRLCIDHLRSARVRREVYVGPWLPEPLVAGAAGTSPDAAAQAEVAQSLSMALLTVLERLSPVERAVFLLHDVFEYQFEEIAALVDKRPENCRQIAVRARRRLRDPRPRFDAQPERREELARRFQAAFEEGDVEGLAQILAEDAVLYADGGGKVPAAPEPVSGRTAVLRLLLGLSALTRRLGVMLRPDTVNGQPGIVTVDGAGRLVGVVALDIADGAIQGVYSLVNPDKLGHLGPTRDLGELLRGEGD